LVIAETPHVFFVGNMPQYYSALDPGTLITFPDAIDDLRYFFIQCYALLFLILSLFNYP
jgi:hypothetical protein